MRDVHPLIASVIAPHLPPEFHQVTEGRALVAVPVESELVQPLQPTREAAGVDGAPQSVGADEQFDRYMQNFALVLRNLLSACGTPGLNSDRRQG
jgi:hypothetical protein